MSLFSLRRKRRDAAPHGYRPSVPANVTLTQRDEPAGLAFTPDAKTAQQIRESLPNAAAPSANLKAARFAAVLDKQAAFLADRTGTVEPPDRWEVVDACRFAADQLRDGIVIA